MASTTLDLPEPLGPTTQVMPGSSRSEVAEAKDLKPFTVSVFRCTGLRVAARARHGRAGGVGRRWGGKGPLLAGYLLATCTYGEGPAVATGRNHVTSGTRPRREARRP